MPPSETPATACDHTAVTVHGGKAQRRGPVKKGLVLVATSAAGKAGALRDPALCTWGQRPMGPGCRPLATKQHRTGKVTK